MIYFSFVWNYFLFAFQFYFISFILKYFLGNKQKIRKLKNPQKTVEKT